MSATIYKGIGKKNYHPHGILHPPNDELRIFPGLRCIGYTLYFISWTIIKKNNESIKDIIPVKITDAQGVTLFGENIKS